MVLYPKRILGSMIRRLLGLNNKPALILAPNWVPEVSVFISLSFVFMVAFCVPP